MPSLAELAGAQALQNASTPGTNIEQGLQAGVQLAGMQQGVELQKAKLQDDQVELQKKQSSAISNRLMAAAFNKDAKQRSILLDGAENLSNQIQLPMNRQAIQAAMDNDDTRAILQKGLKDVQAGKVPDEAFHNIISDSQALFDYTGSKSAEAAKVQQAIDLQNAKDDSAEKRAQIRADATSRAAATRAAASGGGAGVSPGDLKLERVIQAEHNKIVNDKVLTKLTDARNKLETGWNVLTTKSKLTNEEFNDLQIELGGAIAGGVTGVSEGKLSRTEYHTYQQDLSRLVQKITGKPQDSVPPEILTQFKDLFQHVREANAKNTQERAKNLKRNSNIPQVQQAHDEALAPYLNAGQEEPATTSGTTTPAAPAPTNNAGKIAALQKLVGTVNPQTGKPITQSDVDAQLKKRGLK